MPRYDYQRMIRTALAQVVRMALAETAEHGLEGDHHFYILFRTDHPEVVIPPALRDLYPERMTVVLQHRFWDLEAGPEAFSVTVAFGGQRQHLTVPYAAIETFTDPGAELGLQLAPPAGEPGEDAADEAAATPEEAAAGDEAPPDGPGGRVVRTDRFRKR